MFMLDKCYMNLWGIAVPKLDSHPDLQQATRPCTLRFSIDFANPKFFPFIKTLKQKERNNLVF